MNDSDSLSLFLSISLPQTVLVHLLLCLVIFYSLYMIGSVCFGAFRLDHFDGLIPFDFKTEPTNLESNSKYLVNLLSMELAYFCSGLLFAAVVRRWVWDYALTVTLLHVLLISLGETHTHTHRNAYTCLNSLTHTHTGLTQNNPLLAEQSAQGQL
uniref:Transmembrane protein 244 n=1 Tax=Hucho hucho TaxID=62062 RepID=A0A4W5K1D5_9TELE